MTGAGKAIAGFTEQIEFLHSQVAVIERHNRDLVARMVHGPGEQGASIDAVLQMHNQHLEGTVRTLRSEMVGSIARIAELGRCLAELEQTKQNHPQDVLPTQAGLSSGRKSRQTSATL